MNRKLTLELDALVVESFVTRGAEPGRGTVRGHNTLYCSPTGACDTENATCDGAATCGEYTCDGGDNTCVPSCGLCGTYKCTGGDGDLTGNCGSGGNTCGLAC